MHEKFKPFLASDALFTALLIIMVGVVSFGLGRHSALDENMASNKAEVIGVQINGAEAKVLSVGREVIASKSGTKYHLLNCSGAKSIKEENKLYFSSEELAKSAGYLPAANCDFKSLKGS